MARPTYAKDYAFPDDNTERGLTKREYFACEIYSQLLNANVRSDGASPRVLGEYSLRAVQGADCLIEALNSKTEE